MLNNNWKNLFLSTMEVVGNTASSDSSLELFFYNETSYIKTWIASVNATNARNWNSIVFGNIATVQTSIGGNVGVVFGDGTVTPTAEDRTLSGSAISTINATATVSATFAEDGSCTKTAIYTVTNTGSEDVVISEVGYFSDIYMKYQTSSNTREGSGYFLLDHTLLDEPVTIPAGGVGQVTYNITLGANIA